MKLVICTKFQVNRTNCVESRRGGGPIDRPPPPLEASCNYFFFEASRVKTPHFHAKHYHSGVKKTVLNFGFFKNNKRFLQKQFFIRTGYSIIAYFRATLISRIWNRYISRDLSFVNYREKFVNPLFFPFKVLQISFRGTLSLRIF